MSPALTAQPTLSLEVAPGGVFELVASATGFALLTSAKACMVDAGSDRCAGPITPTFLRLGSRLEPVQVEPFLVGERYQPATIGWGLSCEGEGHCFALAGTSDAPTPVYALDLPPRASAFAAPLPRQPPADAPAVVGTATLASGQPYNQVASALSEAWLPARAAIRRTGRLSPGWRATKPAAACTWRELLGPVDPRKKFA